MATPQERLDILESRLTELREQLDRWNEAVEEFRERTEERKVTRTGEIHLRETVLIREQLEHRLPEIREALIAACDDLEESVKGMWGEVAESFRKARDKSAK